MEFGWKEKGHCCSPIIYVFNRKRLEFYIKIYQDNLTEICLTFKVFVKYTYFGYNVKSDRANGFVERYMILENIKEKFVE